MTTDEIQISEAHNEDTGKIDCPWPPCEKCGEPAARAVTDTIERENIVTGWRQFEPDGAPHFFCNTHTRASLKREGAPIFE